MDKREFNDLKKYWRNYHFGDDRLRNDSGNTTGSEKGRGNPKPAPHDNLDDCLDYLEPLAYPVPTRTSLDHHGNERRDILKGHVSHENLDDLQADPVPTQPTSRTVTSLDNHTKGRRDVLKRHADKNTESAGIDSRKYSNSPLTHNVPLSSPSFVSSDGAAAILQHRQNVFKKHPDRIIISASKESTKCTENPEIPLSSPSIGFSGGTADILHHRRDKECADDKSALLQNTRDVLKKHADQIRIPASRESIKWTDIPAFTMPSTPSADISRGTNKIDEQRSTVQDANPFRVTKINELPDESKAFKKFPMIQNDPFFSATNHSFESSDGTVSDASGNKCGAKNLGEQTPVNKQSSVNKQTTVNKQTPVNKQTTVNKQTQQTPLNKQISLNKRISENDSFKLDKDTKAKYHSDIDKLLFDSMEMNWNDYIKQQLDPSNSYWATDVGKQRPVDKQRQVDKQSPVNKHTSIDKQTTVFKQTSVYKQTSVDKHTPVDKQTPVDKPTSVNKQTPVNTQIPVDKQTLVDKQTPVIKRISANDSSELDKATKAKYHSDMDKLLFESIEMNWNDSIKQQMDPSDKCRAKNVGKNSSSTLDRGTLAKYNSQGARPKYSSFLNKAKNSSPNSDCTDTSGERNDVNRSGTTKEDSQHSKQPERNDALYKDQSKGSSAYPDLAETNRRQRTLNLKSEKASHYVNEICPPKLPEKDGSLHQDQSKSSLVNPDVDIANGRRRNSNYMYPETTKLNPHIIKDKSNPSEIHLPNHFQKNAACSRRKPSRSLYVVLLRGENPVTLETLLDVVLGPDSERTILSIEDEQILDITSAILNFSDVQKAEKSFKQLQEFHYQNLLCTWSPVNRRIESLKKYFNDLELHSSAVLKTHDHKIHDIKKQLETCAFDEIEALKIRKEELVRQLREFRNFSKTVRESLQHSLLSEDERTFQSDVEKLVLSFGVECNRLKSALPIYARRSDILDAIRQHQVVIVRGETGSGKSTQLVQYLHQCGKYNEGLIACSQPRKVACVSLAERVASELVTVVGQIVGSKAGMKTKTSPKTKIVFTTHHTLLNECLHDPMFLRYSCLMIDEVHERSIYTDILLSILKSCLPKRPTFKVVIASATFDVQLFKDYFINAPVIEVSGKAFPVEIIWQPKYHQWTDPVQEVVAKAIEVDTSEGPGDILAFVTTQIETEKCKDEFKDRMKNRFNFQCLMLHGQLPPEEQALIFQPTREGQRKIIFSTNSAETSLTIPGIKFVIDSGLVKEMQFDARKNMNTLVVVPVSRSSADQRKGRAGRVSPGKCFRLYTEQHYHDMKPTSTPEILRIHLSQTLLMLYEMKLKPSDCEFVESPPDSAIKTAIETLEELGSIKDDKITDVGKWLVKIPLEPRFGCMIKKGYEMGFVYDTIVFTALCSSSGSIFYRSGDDQQIKESDLKKLTFCDSKGDAFTYLKIYKEWEEVPEKRKNKWCLDNSLNSKSLRGARELVNDICSIFKQNWSIEVKKTFSTEVELEAALQKMILFAFYENIAHSLGHIKMGYYIPNLQQRVFIHPSSALNSLNDSSQWLVFINILRTSRDYITVVTPVEESWIRWVTRLKTKQFDIDEAKSKSVCSVRNQFFGSTTYSFFVGPAYTKLKAYEDLLYESVQVPVVIEADKKTGEVKFICGYNATLPDDLIDDWIAAAKSHVIQRSAEYKVGSNTQTGGVRIVLGLGGEGQLILMPDEYRTVHIKSWNKETSKDTVEDKFKRFGQIADCWEDKRSYHRWGRVTFSTPEAAAEAVRRTQDDSRDAAVPEFKIQKHASFQYQATIEWLRRKPTGLVFVEMDYMEAIEVKSLREVRILSQLCGISLDKKKSSTVLLHKVPTMVTEQDIRLCFPHHSQRQAITKISIIREKTFTDPNELINFRQQIHDQFQEFDQDMKFDVDVIKPYDGNINFRAFIKFNDVSQGTRACEALQGGLTINGQKAQITQKLSTSLSVPEQIYQLLEDEIKEFEAESEENGFEFKLNINKLNNGRHVFNISASNSNDLVHIRMGLAAITKGKVIECWRNENNRYLFLKSGREFLRSLEKRTNTILELDNRLLSLSVFGMENNISVARSEIDQYLGNMTEGDGLLEIKLDAKSQPKGLMKTLVTRYDLELEGFVQASGLQSALLNHRNQTLKICGDSESIENATELIESLAAELRNKTTKSGSEELPDCCTCFCPVESMDHMYRLDACGHVYCLDCIKQQITVAVQSKELPVLCGECQDSLVWSDFEFCFKRLQINPLDLVRSAVSVYMTKNKDGYRHCLTPDCPMVYRITKKSDIFNCNECGLRICSSCHVEYHDGLTCAMLKSSCEAETEMEKYLKENASTVKKCPKCSTPIEKTYGCNRMTCGQCKIHFCWLCCEAFTTESSTYDHLIAHHGGIFDYQDLDD